VRVHKGGMLWDIFGPFKGNKDLAMQRAIVVYDPFQKEGAPVWVVAAQLMSLT